MDKYVVQRFSRTDQGTFGAFLFNDIPICLTLERPWKDNRVGESCITTGIYDCVPHSGERFKGVWELTGVVGRTNILIHKGNTIKDTTGCILVGTRFYNFNGIPGLAESAAALMKLKTYLPQNFKLEVKNP